MPDSPMGQSATSLVTDEMVRKALEVYYMGGPVGARPTIAHDQMRAALEAVQGDIIEQFGASGHA